MLNIKLAMFTYVGYGTRFGHETNVGKDIVFDSLHMNNKKIWKHNQLLYICANCFHVPC